MRPFLGAKDFDLSRQFYRDIGFSEFEIDPSMSVFRMERFSFYLQRAYVKDWVDNTMVFLEVEHPEVYLEHLKSLELPDTYGRVKITGMHYNDWGCEFFMHDPSGILWHVGKFNE